MIGLLLFFVLVEIFAFEAAGPASLVLQIILIIAWIILDERKKNDK